MFENPVDFNDSQTKLTTVTPVSWFENPVDFNDSQTLRQKRKCLESFENPVDFNDSQTDWLGLSLSVGLRTL